MYWNYWLCNYILSVDFKENVEMLKNQGWGY